MSWIGSQIGGEEPAPYRSDPGAEKVSDYAGRKVEAKSANRPYLAYTEYRQKKEAERAAWLQRKKEREEKIAKGEDGGPEEEDPTAEREIGLLGLLKFFIVLILIVTLAGKFFTGSFMWENDQLLKSLKTMVPTNQRLFSESLLAKYDGTDESKPIYLAIDGDVYDVTEGRRTYGPGGSYHFMAGRDAARAFATGCFATHRTHDIRGLTDRQLKGLNHWKNFFAKHKTYTKVGRVVHKPIMEEDPIPEPCTPEKPAEESAATVEGRQPTESPNPKHEEL